MRIIIEKCHIDCGTSLLCFNEAELKYEGCIVEMYEFPNEPSENVSVKV